MNAAFEKEKKENIRKLGKNERLREISIDWLEKVSAHKYSYHFTWLGRPIIQFPQDTVAMQEIIWKVKPE